MSHVLFYESCTLVPTTMKSTRAKHITDTVRFHHHRVVMLTVIQTNCILKLTKDLNKAISDIQHDAPPDYVDAGN
eukprot:15301497-Ditylum_brightwellii.AAC.1